MKRLFTVPLHAPRLTLAVMLAVTVFFGLFAPSLKVDSAIENLLPVHDPEKLYYDAAKKTFGDEAITVIGVFGEDVFSPATLAKIDRLSAAVAEIDGVREVVSLTTVRGVEMGPFGLSTGRLMRELPRTAEEAAAFRARVLRNPLYLKNLVSADGRAAGVSVFFEPMTDEDFITRRIEPRIREAAKAVESPETVAVTGIPTLKVYSAMLMEDDILKFLPFGVLIAVAVLAWAFRTPRGVLLPLITVLAGVVWTMGLMVLAHTPINMGTLVLPPLLIAVGIAYAIYVMTRYYQELRPERPATEVVTATMEHVLLPLGICALTTLIGFATFILTPIRAIREFGIYSVFGIAVVFALTVTILPAALMLLPASKRTSRLDAEDGWLTRLLRGLGENAVQHSRALLLGGLALCAIGALGILRLRVETDFLAFFHPDSAIRIENAVVAERLAGTQPIYVVVDGAGPESVTRLEALRGMQDLQAFIDAQPGVDKTMSLNDYLAVVRGVLEPGAEPLPQSQPEVDQLLVLIDPADIRALVSRDLARANIVVRTSLSGSREVGAFVDRVEAYAAAHMPPGLTVRPTGTVVLLNRSADALVWAQVGSLWQVLAALWVVMSVLFLSVRVGLLSLLPNVFPIILLFGLMGWTGISLNISTSLIAALAIGIAMDDTIHYLSEFNDELRRTGTQADAVRGAARGVGKAMIVTAVALSSGFLVVCLSSFAPVRHFGYLASATMALALLGDLFITPSLGVATRIITLWDLLFLKLGPEPHKQVPLFAGLRPFQARIAVLMGYLESAAPGTFVARQGELKPELYVLLKGRVEVRVGGNSQVIRTLGRGDVVGEMGLVREQPRSADVVATENAEYLVLDRRFLRRLPRRYPRIASRVFLNLTRILSDRIERTTDDWVATPRR